MKRFGFVRKKSTAHSFKKLFSFFMLSFLLLLSACGKEAEKTEAPAEALLLRNGYYTVSDEDGSLKYYWRIKDDQLTVYNPDGSWSDELRLLYDAKNEEYTIEEEKTVFTLRERKDGLQIRTGSGERYMLAKISKDAIPNPAQVTSVTPTETEPLPVQDIELRFLTGGESGAYYAVANALSPYYSKNNHIHLVLTPSYSSQTRIQELDTAEADLAFCTSDVITYAHAGIRLFEKQGRVKSFSVLAAIYPEIVHLITVNPDIKTVSDLQGRSVAVGEDSTASYYSSLDILNAYGLSMTDIRPVYNSFYRSLDDLLSGKIDAAFVYEAIPSSRVAELVSSNNNTRLIALDEEHIQKLVITAPYYAKAFIPAGTYATDQTGSVATVAVSTAILVRSDIDEETVYQLTKTIFDNLSELGLAHPVFRDLTPEYGASIVTVPYHRGAARYFEELGIFVGVSP